MENVLDWENNQKVEGGVEIAFKPARVILQVCVSVGARVTPQWSDHHFVLNL